MKQIDPVFRMATLIAIVCPLIPPARPEWQRLTKHGPKSSFGTSAGACRRLRCRKREDPDIGN